MDLNQINNVYFIGIGGIGMSALARYFKNCGKQVAGYDKSASMLTQELENENIAIHFEDNVNLIPKTFLATNTLVIITPAVPKLHSEWLYFNNNNFNVKKRAEVLGIVTKNTFCFAVAGTHGKTTTSAILGHLLYESGVDVTAFVGGVVENYHSNLIGTGQTVTVVEADEFDRSFLHLSPNLACVTSMDADHLDIYGTKEALTESFEAFASKITQKANLFIAKSLPLNGMTCAVNETADFEVQNVHIKNGQYHFDIKTPNEIINDLQFALPGKHNLTNALMAAAMAKSYGIKNEAIAKALASFRGVRRRFSYQIKTENLVYIDDYAHHPTEINAVHQAVRELYPGKKVLAIFQPHLFSRTRDFAEGFAQSLGAFDELFLMPIYPARELPIEGITSDWLLSKINNPNKKIVEKANLITAVLQSDALIIVTIGAGDVGEMVLDLKHALEKR